MKGKSCDDCKLLIAQVKEIREEKKLGEILLAAKILQEIQEYKIQNEQSQNPNESASLISNIELICKGKLCPAPEKTDSRNVKKFRVDLDDQSDDSVQQQHVNLEPTPEEKAMSNSLIVKEILNFLPSEDQLHCRLINKVWMQVATSKLKKSWDKELRFRFDSESNEYQTINTNESLQNLGDLLENNNNNFPVNKFEFLGGDIGSPDVEKFFTTHGNIVKKLKLYLDEPTSTENVYRALSTFRKILLTVRSTLECLQLDRLPFDPEDHDAIVQLFPDPEGTILFPRLTKIIAPKYVKLPAGLYRDLLNASVNLEITEFHMSRIEDLIETHKIHTVRKIAYHWDQISDEDMKPFCQLASTKQLKLGHINFEGVEKITDTRISGAIKNILDSSRDTLKSISCFDRLAEMDHLQVPVMKNVRDLALDTKPEFLPAGCPVLSQIFPNLIDMHLYCEDDRPSMDELTTMRRKFGVLSCLKYLIIDDFWCYKMVKIISPCFPNITSLDVKLSDVKDAPKVIRFIWTTWKDIQSVNIGMMVYSNRNVCAKMDSSITGMGVKTCAQLYKNSRKVSLEEAKNLRTFPSIFDANNLKDFQLFIINSDIGTIPPIISLVSGIYAFQPVRKERGVKVNIYTQKGIENSVLAVLPYVDIITEGEMEY